MKEKEEMKEYQRKLDDLRRQIRELERERDRIKSNSPLLKRLYGCLEALGIDRAEFDSRSRKKRLFFARSVFAVYLHWYGYATGEIARMLNRDHSSVPYYIRSYKRTTTEPYFDREFFAFIQDFNNQFNQDCI